MTSINDIKTLLTKKFLFVQVASELSFAEQSQRAMRAQLLNRSCQEQKTYMA